ncbi:hypothetical protein [Glycomyces harbinensis]|uniref:Uncharacterized protein n=1 Tax=Glycomyces harbinensis TaxID=58114 RepID=A0A1G6VLG1_9ACTN|nr:hypothetical protein [Glycomyces harbinensis]SDD54361.1 hypothetical protein SAMN05216270_1058 [Glycomyces harbinensis]
MRLKRITALALIGGALLAALAAAPASAHTAAPAGYTTNGEEPWPRGSG